MALAAPEALVRLAEPWADFYGHSTPTSTVITFLHIAPLLVGGGLAVTLDRALLRLRPDDSAGRARHLTELGQAHKWVIGGLMVSAITGLLMLAADLETFLGSPIFWTKMALVALLLLNGFVMNREEVRLRNGGGEDRWRRLRVSAMASLALWLATTFVGVALVGAA